MDKQIFINSNYYDLKKLSTKSNYFLSLYNFNSLNIIDMSFRGLSYEIVLKILLDIYVYDKNFILLYDEILMIVDELILYDDNIFKNLHHNRTDVLSILNKNN